MMVTGLNAAYNGFYVPNNAIACTNFTLSQIPKCEWWNNPHPLRCPATATPAPLLSFFLPITPQRLLQVAERQPGAHD